MWLWVLLVRMKLPDDRRPLRNLVCSPCKILNCLISIYNPKTPNPIAPRNWEPIRSHAKPMVDVASDAGEITLSGSLTSVPAPISSYPTTTLELFPFPRLLIASRCALFALRTLAGALGSRRVVPVTLLSSSVESAVSFRQRDIFASCPTVGPSPSDYHAFRCRSPCLRCCRLHNVHESRLQTLLAFVRPWLFPYSFVFPCDSPSEIVICKSTSLLPADFHRTDVN